MSRERILGAIQALEELAEWFDLMQHGMNGSGFHQGIAAAAAKCRQEAGEWRVKLAALPPEPDPWTPRERRLREAIEKAAERLSRDPEDVEYVDSCPHCGDGAIDNIDSDEWEFDSHGDMLCRLCGGHRGLCGYSTGSGSEVVAILRHALADTPPPDARDEALEMAEKVLKAVCSNKDRAVGFDFLIHRLDMEGTDDALAAIRAAKGSR